VGGDRRLEDEAGADVSASRPAGFRAVALAVAWRSVHNFLTNPAFLVPALVFPLFFFVSFAGGLSAIGDVPGFDFPTGYTAFQFVFVLLQSAAFGGVFTGFGIARDFETGFARRYLLAASNRRGIVAGYALAALVRAFVTWTVLTTVALIAGMQVDGSGVDLFGLYGLAVLVNLAATMWAAGVAMRVRSIQGGPLMQFPTFLVLFLAPVYVPLGLLSGWIHAVASVNPVTALLEAGRGFISGDPAAIALAFTVAVALPVLFGLWARGGLRSAEAAG
jgi:ABC-2 type transport system permease protein